MLEVFLKLSIPLICGVLYNKLPVAIPGSDVRRVISSIVLYIFIPLLTFGTLSNVLIGEHLWTIPLVSMSAVLVGLVCAWLVYGVALRGRISMPTAGSMILASTWCNAMYLGLPIVTAVHGEGARHIPIEYDYLGMTPLLFSVGTMICLHYGSSDSKVSFAETIRNVASLPPMIAIALALVINMLDVPIAVWITESCVSAGKVVPQLMLFSIGLTLRVPNIRSLPAILPAVAIRTIIVPTITWSATVWLIDDPIVESGAILETAMPTMMLTMVFAERYGLDTESLAQAILASTLVSLVTLPLVWNVL